MYTYLREQPIWQSLRFWNAAFFDALQCERIHRPVPKSSSFKKSMVDQLSIKSIDVDETSKASSPMDADDNNMEDVLKEDQQFHQNISFGQLGYEFF